MTDGQLSPKPGESVEEFRERVVQAQKDFKAREKESLKVQPAPEAPKEEVPAEKPAEEPAQPKEPAKEETPSQPAQPTESKAEKPKDSQVDLQDWAKKKGITAEDALRALREKDREFHERRKAEKEKAAAQPYQAQPQVPPQPFIPPMPPPYYQQPYPMPPDRRAILEMEARRRNMLPEDLEKVIEIANDISDFKLNRAKAEYEAQLAEVKRQTDRNAELQKLQMDPAYQNPHVQQEIDRIISEDPTVLETKPQPFLWALDEALKNLGRKNVTGQLEVDPAKSKPKFPTNPPKDAGTGTGQAPQAGYDPEQDAKARFYATKSVEEKRKILSSLGRVNTI